MRKYVFEITFTDEDIKGDELWEEIERDTNSEGVSELAEALQKALMGEYTLFPPGSDEEVKEMVKLKSFTITN